MAERRGGYDPTQRDALLGEDQMDGAPDGLEQEQLGPYTTALLIIAGTVIEIGEGEGPYGC